MLFPAASISREFSQRDLRTLRQCGQVNYQKSFAGGTEYIFAQNTGSGDENWVELGVSV